MTNFELVTAADVQLMQGLAQRVTATRPDLVNATRRSASWPGTGARGTPTDGATWPRRLWFSGGDLVAWGWAQLPHQVRRNDGSVKDVTGAYLAYQVHPDHAGLVDEVIDWYDGTAAGLERTVLPSAADEFALKRWAAHGYETDLAALGDTGSWTQLNERDLTDVEQPVLPAGFRFRTADEAGPEAAVQAHLDAWAPSAYTAEATRASGRRRRIAATCTSWWRRRTGRWRPRRSCGSTRRTRPSSSSRSGRIRATGGSGLGKGDAAARDASGAGGRGHSCDGRLPGCAGASQGARAVLRRRVPGAVAGRAAQASPGMPSWRPSGGVPAPVHRGVGVTCFRCRLPPRTGELTGFA
jgi:hypothetical protein